MQAAPVFIKFWILSKSLALVYICCHRYRILHPDFVLVAALACLEFEVAALAWVLLVLADQFLESVA